MTSTFLVLTGVHSAGKTSVAEYLESQGISVEKEIAEKLVLGGEYEFTTDPSTSFQETLFERERARDQELLDEQADAVIVSWHVAEIAHSMEKASPDLTTRQEEYVESLLTQRPVDVRGVHLSISNETMRRRSETIGGNEEDFFDYYDDVRGNVFDLYEEFGIEYTTVENQQGELQRTCERVAAHVRDLL